MNGWSHRAALTISAAYIDEDLTNWTLVFDQSFNAVLTQINGPLDLDGTRPAKSDGGDIRFATDAAGLTEIAVDLREWTPNNDAALATCEIAVKISFVDASANTTIYLFWGNSAAEKPLPDSLYGQYNAYDSDYELVYPLSENSGSRLDRTSNQETLTPNSTPTAVDGVVGNANSFDGLNDYLYSGTSNPIEGGNTFTVECWSKAPRSQPNGYTDASIVTLATAGVTSDALGFWCDAASPASGRSNLIAWLVAGERIESDTGQWTDDTWEHFAGTSSSTTLKLLINGVEVTDSPKSVAIGNIRSNTRFLVAAWDFDLDRYERNGEIDELRISSTVRSNAWIAANYHNQRNASGFLNFGPIEDIGGIAYSFDYTTELIVERAVTILYDLKLDVDDGSGIPISVSYDLKLDVSTVFFTSYDVSLNVAIISFTSYDILLNVFNSIETDYDLKLDVSTVFFTSYDLKLDVSDNSGVPISVSYDLSLNILFNVETNYDLRLNVLSNLGYSFDYNTVLDVVRNIDTSYDIKLIIDYGISTSYDLRLNVLSIYGHFFDYNTVLDVILNINTSYDVSLTVIDILNELITICDIEYSTSSFNIIDVRLLDSESFIEFFNSIIYVSYTPILVNTCELLFSISDIGVYFGVNNSENLFSTCDISFDLPIINSILNISLSFNSIIEFNLSEVALVRQLLILTDDVITFNTTNILLSILHELDTNSVIVINTNSITIYLERFNISNIKSYENVTVIRSYEPLICRKGE
jgi:hypothetical protein